MTRTGKPMPAKRGRLANAPLSPDQQALVADNVALAWWYVGRFMRYRLNESDREDLASWLIAEGLVRAAQLYDPGRKIAFTTYAGWWLKSAMNRWYLARDRRLAVGDRQLSVIQQSADEDDRPLALHGIMDGGQERYDDAELVEVIRGLLPPRWWQALKLRCLEGQTLKCVARKLGCSKDRARQIIEMAVERVRKRLKRETMS